MAKVNAFALTRPPRAEWTLVLKDPVQPDVTPTLQLTELNVIEQLAALEKSEVLTRKYVTGQGRPGEPDYVAPLPFPPVGGQAVDGLSERVFEAACLIERAQTGDSSARYSAAEIVALMTIPGFAKGILEAAQRVEGACDPFGVGPEKEGG